MFFGNGTFFAPSVTPDQQICICNLGNLSWRVREKASKDLSKLDFSGLRAFYEAANDPDPEIAIRGKRLLNNFYHFSKQTGKLPGIQNFQNLNFKFKSGNVFLYPNVLISKHYIDALKNGVVSSNRNKFYFDPYYMRFDASNDYTREATVTLIRHLRNIGYTKEEILELINVASEHSDWDNWESFREITDMYFNG